MKTTDINDPKKYSSDKFIEPDNIRSHHEDKISLVKDLVTNKEYIFKDVSEDPEPKFAEVIGQEIFRLMMPNHPEFRFVVNDDKEIVGVISEKIKGKQLKEQIFDDKGNKVTDGSMDKLCAYKYKGIGGIHICALFTGETDLKLSNMFKTNKSNWVVGDRSLIKIDGDRMFRHLVEGDFYKPDISKGTIAELPFLLNNTSKDMKTIKVWNWVGQVKFGIDKRYDKNEQKHINLLLQMQSNKEYRNEVNGTLLKILLLDEASLDKFLSIYTSSIQNGDKIKEILLQDLKSAKQQLYSDAIQDPSFRLFMKSPASQKVLNSFKEDLAKFQNNSNRVFQTEEDIKAMSARLDSTFTFLQNKIDENIVQNPVSSQQVEPHPILTPEELKIFADEVDHDDFGMESHDDFLDKHDDDILKKQPSFMPSKGNHIHTSPEDNVRRKEHKIDTAHDKEVNPRDKELQAMLLSVRKSDNLLSEPTLEDSPNKHSSKNSPR